MGVREVAETLGVSPAAVRKAIARGTLRATLVPGGRRGAWYAVERDEVERYRRHHLRPPGPSGYEAYGAIAEELSDERTTLDSLDPDVVARAREYATRRKQKWPPRPTTSGVVVTISKGDTP